MKTDQVAGRLYNKVCSMCKKISIKCVDDIVLKKLYLIVLCVLYCAYFVVRSILFSDIVCISWIMFEKILVSKTTTRFNRAILLYC